MVRSNDLHAELIRHLGGKAKLAEQLGLDRDVLTKWHRRGIPSRYWHRVVELARGIGITITAEELDSSKPVAERVA